MIAPTIYQFEALVSDSHHASRPSSPFEALVNSPIGTTHYHILVSIEGPAIAPTISQFEAVVTHMTWPELTD